MPLGVYISVPFCRSKCSYCNFASDVFSRSVFEGYVGRVCADVQRVRETAERMGGVIESSVDTVYLGGGTPTVLETAQLERLFVALRQNFEILPEAEITVECAPGTLKPAMVEAFERIGVNRVSLGVQSFVDEEARAVGRLHKSSTVAEEVGLLRSAGISNLNIDLIAGLPHQTSNSWEDSLEKLISLEAPHASIYMLEVDEDSRLGREVMAGGNKYHAHFVPDDDLTVELYERACERLDEAGIQQYEISNFARVECESKHNLKYWTRQPYIGFGVDAHSMLQTGGRLGHAPSTRAVRFSTADSLEKFMSGGRNAPTQIDGDAALEEELFLGLRMIRGVDLVRLRETYGESAMYEVVGVANGLISHGLLRREGERISLSSKGRLLSNEVFERFIGVASLVR